MARRKYQRRTRPQVLRDQRVMAAMYLRGKTQPEIAEALGLSAKTVMRDLAVLNEQWLAESKHDVGLRKARIAAKLQHLEDTYWGAWEKSLEEGEADG